MACGVHSAIIFRVTALQGWKMQEWNLREGHVFARSHNRLIVTGSGDQPVRDVGNIALLPWSVARCVLVIIAEPSFFFATDDQLHLLSEASVSMM